MSTQIVLKVLALRHRLRQRDRWTRRELAAQGAIVSPVKVGRVSTIPRTTVGKAPLIKSSLPASEMLGRKP